MIKNTTNYKAKVKFLQKYYTDADQIVIPTNSGKIIYSTDNWDVKNI
jgi:hypothetical protein